jgi:hypothetical protein
MAAGGRSQFQPASSRIVLRGREVYNSRKRGRKMGLNIKDRGARLMAEELSRLTGETVPPIVATSFMTIADYLDDLRYVRANRYPARRARGVILRACDRE